MSLFSHPVKKLTLLAAFGIGYTLGAKAGRERYEQIVDAANQVKSDPRVQDAAAKAEGLVRETATKVADDPRIKDAVHRAEDLLGDAEETAKDAAEEATTKAKDIAADVKDAATSADDKPVSPLLADEHVESAEEVVYSAGRDIEETIDELAPTDDRDRI